MKRLFLMLAISVFSMAGFAEEVAKKEEWRLMLGGDFGVGFLTTNVPGEFNKQGPVIGTKLILAGEWDRYTINFGAGLAYHDVGADSNSTFSINQMQMAAFLLEIGMKYQIVDKVHIGPVLNLLMSNDTSMRELNNPTATYTSPQGLALLVGAEALYDLSTKEARLYVGLRAMTDVTIESRQMVLIQGVVQIGLPIFEVNRTPAVAVQPVVEAPVAVTAPEPKPSYEFKLSQIHFVTGKDELDPRSQVYIENLGKILATYQADFETVTVEGHTDKRGSYELNKDLSQERAESVKEALVRMGVVAEKIFATGYSFDQLLDQGETPEAHARNRRAIVKFMNLKDDSKLKAALAGIKPLE